MYRVLLPVVVSAFMVTTGAVHTIQRAADSCTPIETRPPNAPDQIPAFPGQTRICKVQSNFQFDVTTITDGLNSPWAVEPLPEGDLLVTEKPGFLRIVTQEGIISQPITGLPAVAFGGQGGLLDVALSPSFASDQMIYWSYSEPREGGNGTSVARGILSPDRQSLQQVQVIFQTIPTYDGQLHFGSRLAFGPDGMLYITLGERWDTPIRVQAQQLDSDLGKILRITPDGSVPGDNPFVGQKGALPEIWTLGHRNIQASTFDTQGRLWIVEHGAQGGDEVNLISVGKNYGWPFTAYGEEYSGEPFPDGLTQRPGTEQPVYYWDPAIAPSGAQFYTGGMFPEWQGSLFIGALKQRRLVRLTFDTDGRVSSEEHLLADREQRVRDVRQGPDGTLYVVTDEGELWKLTCDCVGGPPLPPFPPPSPPLPPLPPSPPGSPSAPPGATTCNGLPATIIGTASNDVLTGTIGRDVIVGLAGDDIIHGLSGNDVICGGSGNDQLFGQHGRDKLLGGSGSDLCRGGAGVDKVKGCERK